MQVISSPLRLLASSLLFAAAVALPAQGNGLVPGTFVGTTFGYGLSGGVPTRFPAGDTVVTIDTFAGTASQLTVSGFPSVALEFPWAVHIESRLSFLVGSGSFVPGVWNMTLGNVYRVSVQNGAWTATRLNSNTIGEGVWSIAEIGDTIYFTTTGLFSQGTNASSKVWSMSRWGGTASVLVDLSGLGAEGTGGALVALGSTLHVFTFRSDYAPSNTGEHWAIQTSSPSPTASRIGALPLSDRPGYSFNLGLGVTDAQWHEGEGAFVISGIFGDLLWRDPVGNDVRQWASSTPFNLQAPLEDQLGGLAIDTDTGAIILGDQRRHIEEMRSPRGRYRFDQLTLPLISEAAFTGLDYLPTNARYLPDGPIGCPQQSGEWPCSYVDSRPTSGNTNFAFTLETSASNGFLVLGFDNAAWGGNLLPYSLSSWGAPGCVVGTSVDVVVPFVGPDPSIAAPLPNMAFHAWTQWAVFDPANPLGLVLSEARRMEVR